MTAEEWNAAYPVGTPVRYFPVKGRPEHTDTVTRSEAWDIQGVPRVVSLVSIESRTGGVSLEHLQVLTEPPHGYMPFLVEHRGERKWVCATPHCDDADALVRDVEHPATFKFINILDWNGEAYDVSRRILRLFDSRDEAVLACWRHASKFWHGEPPPVPAIPAYYMLPPGYTILVEAEQRRVWLVLPDGKMTGKVSGTCLSTGLNVYKDQALAHEIDLLKLAAKEQP